MDIKSKNARSRNMSKIRSRDTKPELFIRSELHKRGYRFRVNSNLAEGHPDIYFTKKRVAVFVHGCYWHRHPGCKYAYIPKTNVDFWMKKFSANVERDRLVRNALAASGVRVLIIWECSVRRMMSSQEVKSEYLSEIDSFMNDEDISILQL